VKITLWIKLDSWLLYLSRILLVLDSMKGNLLTSWLVGMSFVDSKSYRRWSRLLTRRRRDNRASFSRYRTPRSLRHRGMCVCGHLLIIIIILYPIFSIQVRAYSSRKSWRLQFHNSELHFRTRPPNLCSHRRCERDFVLIPTHFYHAAMLQLRAFARHSASWPAGPMTVRHFDFSIFSF